MSKLNYPAEGINSFSADLVDKSKAYLRANLNVSFNVPSGFEYRSYILKLNTKSLNFYKEITSIGNAISDTNVRFSNMSQEISDSVSKLVSSNINARGRMIK